MNAESIAGKTFTSVRKGWKQEEVHAYLQLLAEDIVALADENKALRAEILRLEERAAHVAELEDRVRKMVHEMKSASKRMVGHAEASAAAMSYKVEQERKAILDHAKHEAAVIIRDAERRAERQLIKGNARIEALNEQIDLLETKKLALITRIKSILRAQVDFLAALETGSKGGALRSAMQRATHTKEGIDAEAIDEIIESLDHRETDYD